MDTQIATTPTEHHGVSHTDCPLNEGSLFVIDVMKPQNTDIMVIIGRNERHETVVLQVHDFDFYFFVRFERVGDDIVRRTGAPNVPDGAATTSWSIPSGGDKGNNDDDDDAAFQRQCAARMIEVGGDDLGDLCRLPDPDEESEHGKGGTLRGFRFIGYTEEMYNVQKIIVNRHCTIDNVRRRIQNAVHAYNACRNQATEPRIHAKFYESQISPENLFIIDHHIKIMSWIKYRYNEGTDILSRNGAVVSAPTPMRPLRYTNDSNETIWRAMKPIGKRGIALEINVSSANIAPHTEYEDESRSIPMLRALSFDTEAYGHDDRFPIPRWTTELARNIRKSLVEVKDMPTDPLICIGFTVKDTFKEGAPGEKLTKYYVYAYDGTADDLHRLHMGLIRAQNSNAHIHELKHADRIVASLDSLIASLDQEAAAAHDDNVPTTTAAAAAAVAARRIRDMVVNDHVQPFRQNADEILGSRDMVPDLCNTIVAAAQTLHDEIADGDGAAHDALRRTIHAGDGADGTSLPTIAKECSSTRSRDTIIRDPIEFVSCRNELEMIHKFLDFIEENDIDYITGWNTDSFDFGYMIEERLKYYDELSIAQRHLDAQYEREHRRRELDATLQQQQQQPQPDGVHWTKTSEFIRRSEAAATTMADHRTHITVHNYRATNLYRMYSALCRVDITKLMDAYLIGPHAEQQRATRMRRLNRRPSSSPWDSDATNPEYREFIKKYSRSSGTAAATTTTTVASDDSDGDEGGQKKGKRRRFSVVFNPRDACLAMLSHRTMQMRLSIDAMVCWIKEFGGNHTSFALDAVANDVLKDRKIKVGYNQVNERWRTRTELASVYYYCIYDAVLPQRLIDSTQLIMRIAQTVKLNNITMQQYLTRGQQVRVWNDIVERVRYNDEKIRYFIPDKPFWCNRVSVSGQDPFNVETMEYVGLTPGETRRLGIVDPSEQKYSGGHVFEPHVGAHLVPVTTKDYKSLYPNCEIEKNACYVTITCLRDMERFGLTDRDVNYIRVQNKPNNRSIGEPCPNNPNLRMIAFVRPHKRRGVVPQILIDLLSARALTRKEMRKCDMTTPAGRNLHTILDSKQLAQKLTCNAVYGFTGARNGTFAMREIALATTAFGVACINYTRDVVENIRVEVHIDDPDRLRRLQPSDDHDAFSAMDPSLCVTGDDVRIVYNVENRPYLKDFEAYMNMYYYPVSEVGEYRIANPRPSLIALYGDTDSIMTKHHRYFIRCPGMDAREIEHHERRLKYFSYGLVHYVASQVADMVIDGFRKAAVAEGRTHTHMGLDYENLMAWVLYQAKKKYNFLGLPGIHHSGVTAPMYAKSDITWVRTTPGVKPKSKGNAGARGDSVPYTRKVMRRILTLFGDVTRPLRARKIDILLYLRKELYERLAMQNIPFSELILNNKYKQHRDEYKGTPAVHVSVVENNLKLDPHGYKVPAIGDRVHYVYHVPSNVHEHAVYDSKRITARAASSTHARSGAQHGDRSLGITSPLYAYMNDISRNSIAVDPYYFVRHKKYANADLNMFYYIEKRFKNDIHDLLQHLFYTEDDLRLVERFCRNRPIEGGNWDGVTADTVMAETEEPVAVREYFARRTGGGGGGSTTKDSAALLSVYRANSEKGRTATLKRQYADNVEREMLERKRKQMRTDLVLVKKGKNSGSATIGIFRPLHSFFPNLARGSGGGGDDSTTPTSSEGSDDPEPPSQRTTVAPSIATTTDWPDTISKICERLKTFRVQNDPNYIDPEDKRILYEPVKLESYIFAPVVSLILRRIESKSKRRRVWRNVLTSSSQQQQQGNDDSKQQLSRQEEEDIEDLNRAISDRKKMYQDCIEKCKTCIRENCSEIESVDDCSNKYCDVHQDRNFLLKMIEGSHRVKWC